MHPLVCCSQVVHRPPVLPHVLSRRGLGQIPLQEVRVPPVSAVQILRRAVAEVLNLKLPRGTSHRELGLHADIVQHLSPFQNFAAMDVGLVGDADVLPRRHTRPPRRGVVFRSENALAPVPGVPVHVYPHRVHVHRGPTVASVLFRKLSQILRVNNNLIPRKHEQQLKPLPSQPKDLITGGGKVHKFPVVQLGVQIRVGSKKVLDNPHGAVRRPRV
mmetsp:Transcript_132892/g.301804  ORF Transcript_132892/g.301804 Transcript_132892/m.301804 type:complete len:216 (-) Transcript_132892:382-1029(-)